MKMLKLVTGRVASIASLSLDVSKYFYETNYEIDVLKQFNLNMFLTLFALAALFL